MPQDLDLDSDPFLRQLTDALRAGPGSPEWHQAVASLRERGAGNAQADEYKMLIDAREHLESGKEYRSVRAGPGFARKLFRGIDEGGSGGAVRGFPTATAIAVLAALAMIAVAGFFIYPMIFTHATVDQSKASVDDLLRVRGELLNESASARFDAPVSSLPAGWLTIGRLRLDTAGGLHPAAEGPTTAPASGPCGGGIVAPGAFPPDEPFAAEADLRLGRPSDDTLFEFFISTDPSFTPDRATSTSELVWLLQGNRQKVLLSGREQVNASRPEPPSASGSSSGESAAPTAIRILINRDSAVVECDGRRVWAGLHGLPAIPRYVGVRFLQIGARPHEPATVISLHVMKK